ncbi:hypothetical protein JR064_07995 [Xanthomonas sp. CFBP 8703]|uniref:Uncharacterized protein n=1 Tax=Xanthomonas bonasiae TaxID=2810351 RepID=A0ABS3B212_9XANT|nr:hypothetical protein [Xanthomonas bonasiae]MBN6102104.1 hypothetical protein [Xanthomonas bonasiae]
MSDSQPKAGELFSRQYIPRGAPTRDSALLRNRLDAYLQANHYGEYSQLASYLRQEGGLIISMFYSDKFNSTYFNFTQFFTQSPIEHVLSSITLVWRYFKATDRKSVTKHDRSIGYIHPKATAWREFVNRALREENVGYVADAECGVHFFVDEEFERNRASALACLASPRHAAVRAAFEQSHAYLDSNPPDTKAAVRSSFESLEILARLIDPTSRNLNRWMVENKLKPLIVATAINGAEGTMLDRAMDGFAQLVDGIHTFRHGQGTSDPVAPSLPTAVYVASSTAAALRLLAPVDLGSSR